MVCDICKQKKATVFLTQIIKGEMQKVNLCQACSKEKGVTDPTGFALADMLLGFGGEQPEEAATKEKACPACGMTQATFRKAGRLGCSQCYTAFGDGMEGLLKAMHKGTRHVGKVPAFALERRATEDRLAELQAALQTAVTSEQFEDAARLRDEVRKLSEQIAHLKAVPNPASKIV